MTDKNSISALIRETAVNTTNLNNIKDDMSEVKTTLDELRDYIKGNGKPGINERLRRVEDQVGINDHGLSGMVTGLWRNGKATVVAYGVIFVNWMYDILQQAGIIPQSKTSGIIITQDMVDALDRLINSLGGVS